MSVIPVEVRERVVKAYLEGRSGTYAETAVLFSVGEASLSRWLRKARASESLEPRWSGGPKRRIDLAWLKQHVQGDEDARLIDRIAAWEAHSGVRMSIGAMWNGLRAIGVTHKKRPR
jgi:transposase